MTDEELKNIKAPSKDGSKPLTESQKKRNTVFLQLGGALLLFIFSCAIVPPSIIGAIYLLGDNPSKNTILSVVMFVAIVVAWFLSRQVCKIIVKKFLKDKITAEAVELYK